MKNYLSVSEQIIIFATECNSNHNKKPKTIPSSMKIIITVFAVLLALPISVQSGFAQKSSVDDFNLTSYEIMPRFPGGDKALSDFIKRNMHYPKSAMKKGIGGRVVVKFYVETDGRLTDFSIEKSVNSQLDKEALRIIKKMPKWEPGQLGGRVVRMSCMVPVIFRCENYHAPLVLRPDSANKTNW